MERERGGRQGTGKCNEEPWTWGRGRGQWGLGCSRSAAGARGVAWERTVRVLSFFSARGCWSLPLPASSTSPNRPQGHQVVLCGPCCLPGLSSCLPCPWHASFSPGVRQRFLFLLAGTFSTASKAHLHPLLPLPLCLAFPRHLKEAGHSSGFRRVLSLAAWQAWLPPYCADGAEFLYFTAASQACDFLSNLSPTPSLPCSHYVPGPPHPPTLLSQIHPQSLLTPSLKEPLTLALARPRHLLSEPCPASPQSSCSAIHAGPPTPACLIKHSHLLSHRVKPSTACWNQILPLPLKSCVTSGSPFSLSEP